MPSYDTKNWGSKIKTTKRESSRFTINKRSTFHKVQTHSPANKTTQIRQQSRTSEERTPIRSTRIVVSSRTVRSPEFPKIDVYRRRASMLRWNWGIWRLMDGESWWREREIKQRKCFMSLYIYISRWVDLEYKNMMSSSPPRILFKKLLHHKSNIFINKLKSKLPS